VSQGFKKDRFLKCHVIAIRWPIEKVVFTGATPWSMDSVGWDEENIDKVLKAEYQNVSILIGTQFCTEKVLPGLSLRGL